MLRSLKALHHTPLEATDGPVGTVSRFLIDVDHWTVRYLVVDAGDWWEDHEVLISPMSISEDVGSSGHIEAALTRTQVRHSPEYDRTQPFTREHELALLGYYDCRAACL